MSATQNIDAVEIKAVPNPAGQEDAPTTYVQRTIKGSMPIHTKTTISAEEFNDGAWASSDVCRRLGFALKIKHVPVSDDTPGATTYSRRINAITANLNPESDDFGKYATAPVMGKILVAREDSAYITAKHTELTLEYLHRYINICHAPAPANRERMIYAMDTPMFKMYWDSYCNMMASRTTDQLGKHAWLNLKCPITEEPGCKICRKKGTDEQPLLKCSACRTVTCCGKECQRKDWKGHKTVCKIQNLIGAFGSVIRQ